MKVLDPILAQEEALNISLSLIVSLNLNEFKVKIEQGQ
jgi:hypothetical protein